MKAHNITSTQGIYSKSLLFENEWQEIIFMTINEENYFCQYNMTLYHREGLDFVPFCYYIVFDSNADVMCYSMQGLTLNGVFKKPYIFCA